MGRATRRRPRSQRETAQRNVSAATTGNMPTTPSRAPSARNGRRRAFNYDGSLEGSPGGVAISSSMTATEPHRGEILRPYDRTRQTRVSARSPGTSEEGYIVSEKAAKSGRVVRDRDRAGAEDLRDERDTSSFITAPERSRQPRRGEKGASRGQIAKRDGAESTSNSKARTRASAQAHGNSEATTTCKRSQLRHCRS